MIHIAELYPWYGYKKVAVICRRAGYKVKNRHAYRVMDEYGLLHRRRCPMAEIHQAAKLYELLPKGPNELWQMDVTYVQIPGYGWWYAIAASAELYRQTGCVRPHALIPDEAKTCGMHS